MKKLLIVLMLLVYSGISNATTHDPYPTKEERTMVARVGYNLLNSNRIPHKITFSIKDSKVANSWIYYSDNEVIVTKELIKTMGSDDELAAILGHEISHGVDYRQGILKGYFSFLSTKLASKKYEYKADKRAIDYMVKAGYHPVASIIAFNKIIPQRRFDWCSSHPLTSRRMAEIYEYIYTKYPQYLVQNPYKDNLIYQNFLLTSKENRAKLEQKIKNNSKRKINYL